MNGRETKYLHLLMAWFLGVAMATLYIQNTWLEHHPVLTDNEAAGILYCMRELGLINDD